MKKLLYLFILLCLPVIISAQQSISLRKPIDNKVSRDSIMKMLLPIVEKWRQDYNTKGINQISPFYTKSSGNNSSNINENIKDGHVCYVADFQKEIDNRKPIDSMLIFSINATSDEAKLFAKQTGLARQQDTDIQNIMVIRKINGTWITIPLFESKID